ncbi:C4-dicarboxylate transporter DctA [Galactobacter valiniphilus]|uniref:C4-dicarboxylate transporter DctA n=1 Tax=Galactobacter valiniphilus TaxID=2676122 RepID=A0A399JF48_9MICC|nr:cation:dicarboxylase symporter family transporter [Galactobacter valiniphilus]RII42799.1 C4-dicarboxylate transporter DctA [Galactobacter valiniphilus]
MALSEATPLEASQPPAGKRRKDRTHWLYIAVIAAVVLGIVVGLVMGKDAATAFQPLGDLFIALIKMIIAPVIFCTIVTGVGSIAKAATVGKVGGLALVYFLIMSTFALVIGLVVGNLIHPGDHLKLSPYDPNKASGHGAWDMIFDIIPGSLPVLPTLFVALLVGFALQSIGERGKPILDAMGRIQSVVLKIMTWIMWVAPIGAFGAIAAVVGKTGWGAIGSMLTLMGAFYLTCIIFIVVILGTVLRTVTGLNIFKLMRYLGREYLLIFSTSSSESALPRLMSKMEHAGVSKPVVGVVVPTGYSFNLDGTAIYLTMAALFVANAMGMPLNIGEQIALLVVMIIAAKGAAGVSGAGLSTLAAGLDAHRPEMLGGMGVVVGIDKFMSEARALTNFTGNAVATLLVGKWTGELDVKQAKDTLEKRSLFDETTVAEH